MELAHLFRIIMGMSQGHFHTNLEEIFNQSKISNWKRWTVNTKKSYRCSI